MSGLFVFPDPVEEDRVLRQVESYEEEYRRWESTMRRDPTPAIRTADTAAVNPTIPTSAIVYGSQRGLAPDDPIYEQVAQAQADDDLSTWEQLAGRLGDAMRWTMAALNTPWDEIQRGYKVAAGAAADLGLEMYPGQTDPDLPWWEKLAGGLSMATPAGLGESIIDALERGRELSTEFDQPDEFLEAVGGTFAERNRQLPHSPFVEALAGRQDIGDQRFLFLPIPDYSVQEEAGRAYEAWGISNPTPGRIAASTLTGEMVRPDTAPHNLMSGLFDASLLLRADPVNVAGRSIHAARRASRVFAGLAGDGDRIANVMRPRAHTWLSSPNGRNTIRALTDITSPKEVARLTKITDPATLSRIARTTDPNRMYVELFDAINHRYLTWTPTKESLVGAWTRRGDVVGRGLWVPTAGQLAGAAGGWVMGGTDMARYGATFGVGAVFGRRMAGGRLARHLGELAAQSIDMRSKSHVFQTLSRAMDNWGFDISTQDDFIRRLGAIDDGDGNAVFELMFKENGVMPTLRNKLIADGVHPDVARHITTVWKDAVSPDVKRIFTDATGLHPIRLKSQANVIATTDELMELAHKPILGTEMLNASIPLPDMRQIWRAEAATSRMGRLALLTTGKTVQYSKDGLRSLDLVQPGWGTVLMDGIVQSLWKPIVLLRVAWLARVAPEEAARMAAAGYSSAFSDPVDWLMWAFSKKRRSAAVGTLDSELVDFRAAMSRNMDLSWADSRRTQNVAGQWRTVRQNDRWFVDDWTYKMSLFWNDPVARRVVALGVDDTAEWLARGKGQKFATQLRIRRTHQGFDVDDARAYAELVDAYLHRSTGGHVTASIDRATGRKTWNIERPGYDELRESVATGNLGGHRVHNLIENTQARKAINGQMRKFATRLEVDARTIDDVMGYTGAMNRRNWTTSGPVRRPVLQSRKPKDIVDWMFRMSMGATTDILNRAPLFRQAYWEKFIELASFADVKTLRAMVRRARSANIGGQRIAKLERMLARVEQGALDATIRGARTGADGTNLAFRRATKAQMAETIDDIDMIAKSYAIARTQELLYDLQKRRQVTDVARNVFPFAEAWYEIISTWSKLLKADPSIIYRMQRGGNALTTGGFIFSDPDTGEDVFAMPLVGGRFTTSMLYGPPGAPEEANTTAMAVGRVAGVNLIGSSVLPGLGPVVQFPLSRILQRVAPGSEANMVREVLFPFGEPDPGLGGVVKSFLPAWAVKVETAMQDEHGLFAESYSGAYADTMRALSVSGLYDPHTPEGQERLDEDAHRAAWRLTMFRAAVQFTAPTGVAIRYKVEDKNGMEWFTRMLSEDYRDILDACDNDTVCATETFFARYGIDPVALVTPKTDAEKPDIDTDAGMAWWQDNPDIYEEFPFTASFVNPADIDDEFSYTAYARSVDANRRHIRTSDEWAAAVQRARINLSYQAIRRRLEERAQAAGRELTDAERVYLRNVQGRLDQLYPRGSAIQIDYEERRTIMLDELRRWADNPKVADTPIGQAVATYLAARANAGNEYNRRTGRPAAEFYLPAGVSDAKGGEDLRIWLNGIAEQLIERVPEFQRVWDYVFRREVD